MAVGEGKFQLYSRIQAPLDAGDWRLVANQNLEAQAQTGTLTPEQLRIDEARINFRVRSPRYLLPPDQVLSTFPPANSFGNYGSRLPQVVIKRRTLPWERRLDGAPEGAPWLALVLIAEGEARLETGVDVADCITPGVTLPGIADVEKGNCLVVRKSVIDKVFPTRNDVPLLAHAREVDINDTELMMGDDDGFLAVVISNRLPLPARDENGEETPTKYLACLINLEGQFDALLEKSPDPEPEYFTPFPLKIATQIKTTAHYDHVAMGSVPARAGNPDVTGPGPTPREGAAKAGSTVYSVSASAAATASATSSTAKSQWSTVSLDATASSARIQVEMARDFNIIAEEIGAALDPEFRFPVLMHWSFTSTESTTFRSLMEGLDSRLLGDAGESSSEPTGRLPLEVVETGHVGLDHKTREGDAVRSWYRGPLAPHPTAAGDRLPLAYSSDQLRIVIPDGREDLSLASAFEVGRLLALSQPSKVAALLRWRQQHYQAARLASLIEANRPVWEKILGAGFELADLDRLGPKAGRFLIDAIVEQPEAFLGAPRPRVTPGRPLPLDGLATDILGAGLGLDKEALRGDVGRMLEALRETKVPVVEMTLGDLGTRKIHAGLEKVLDRERVDLVTNTLANRFVFNPVAGPAFPPVDLAPVVIAPDALDAILEQERDAEDEEQP